MNDKRPYKSVCRICHGGCGALLFVKDNRLVRVKPDKDSPFSNGQMCIKGLATAEMMYHPNRIIHPLKRMGTRGGKQWKKISWETAFTEIAEKIKKIKNESGPEAIAIGQGTGRHHFMHVVRFANTLGTPNWYEPGLANCFIPRISVCNYTYGGFVSADYYGKTNPETILFWGHNPVLTGADGEISFLVKRALKRGSYGIAIDPRKSETAKKCGLWLPIRPGTDCSLALSMINVIINENIYDHNFVDNFTTGFQRLKTHVKDFTPAWAEAITGVPSNLIITAAKRYAIAKPSVLEWGVAIEQTPNSLQTVRALSLLRGITGNIDAPGSDVFGNSFLKPYPVLKNKLPKKASKKRLGGSEFKLLGGFRAFMPSAHIPAVFKAMRFGDPYKIRALLNFGSNPLVTIANTKNVFKAISALELVVVSDMFMTPTAAMADYILPAAFWPEVNQIMEIPYVAEHAVIAQQKVVSVGECRQDEDILTELAARLELPGSSETLEDILDYRLSSLDITFNELKEKSYVFPEMQYYRFRDKGFRTPSGKIELYSNSLRRMGYEPLPVYNEPPESPVSTKHLLKNFPLILTTGARRNVFFHSEHRQIKSLRKKHPFPVAEINVKDAEDNGIKQNDPVYITSPRGRIKMRALVTENIVKGVINIDHGWWFPEKEDTDFGIYESNANLLTSDKPPYDKAFGSYQLRGLLCSIQKIM